MINGIAGMPGTPMLGASGQSGGLGKDAFLRLLVTQMRYQDPLKPMEDRAYLAELAQFASLERLDQVAGGFQDMAAGLGDWGAATREAQALSLLGKTVRLGDGSQAQVTSVDFADGLPLLRLADDRQVDLAQVVSVLAGEVAP